MRIGINGRFLVAQKTGVQRAAYNMVSALLRVDRENQYFIFTGFDEVGKEEWNFPNVFIIPSLIRGGETFKNLLWEQLELPRLAERYKVDILHSPANMSPLFYRGKSIVHIHDLCFVVNPQWYKFSFRTWYRFVIPRLAKAAHHVVTNSNNSRNDLMKFCRIEVKKISLVYWAVDDSFLGGRASKHDTGSPVDIAAMKPYGYILYVGSLEPRKNIRNLIEAFEKMRRDHPHLKTKLILIGGENPLFADVNLKVREFRDDVIIKGFVDELTLKSYYQHASLVAYPSLYEGFGLPPLEAMASGTAVVTSNTSSIPEVVGDAAFTVNPHNVSELSSAMAQVLSDEGLRQSLVNKGFEQIKKFNWPRVARNIMAIYHKVHYNEDIPYDLWWDKLVAKTPDPSLPLNCNIY